MNKCLRADRHVLMYWCWIPSVASWLARRQSTGSDTGVGDRLNEVQNFG